MQRITKNFMNNFQKI